MNAATLFVADLHLDPEARPETVALFLRFLAGHARGAAHLYILGDLFEVWIGDDDDAPGHGPILDGLRDLVASGVPAGFMTGNRDFLAGTRFTERSGCGLLADPTVIELGGVRTLLTHGDRLCIDDAGHMRFREMVDSSDFRDWIADAEFSQNTPESYAWAKQNHASVREKQAEYWEVWQQKSAADLAERTMNPDDGI